ncbi:uncharacterized protein LOC118756168 [Rhagoletis pomonella]|uniref:uncharacterized protein LOC118756168 n=1 Tax=Rhagoletis pomonella TaxID=28610 RepID=UPI0017827F53|nr:uncharacterized protein LOC118756168 [Rhagoletis pomonella]
MAKVEMLSVCVRAIERAAAYVRSEEFASVTHPGASARLEVLEGRWKQCMALHDELVLDVKEGDKTKNYDVELEKAEEGYFEARAALQGKINELCPTPVPVNAPANIQVELQYPQRQMDLKNNWGEFDGALTKWKGFHDRFKAAVHDNEQVAPAFKFTYLQKSLVGKAARTLGEWQLTDENYHEAWERLKQLYDKKYHTCREYLRQFYRLPFLERASSDALQRMANVTHETLRQLRAQGLPVEHWDMIVVHNLHERLDEETGKACELQRQSETPTAAEILTFLDKQAAASSHQADNRRAREASAASTTTRASQIKRAHQGASNGASTTRASIGQKSNEREKKTYPCHLCKGDHGLYKCPDFLSLNLRSRKAYVERHKLCPNCFKQGHAAKDCYSGPCNRCPGKILHNSVLCPTREVNKHLMLVQDKGNPNRASSPSKSVVKRKPENGNMTF